MRRLGVLALCAFLSACGTNGTAPSDEDPPALATETIEAGEVTVTIDPLTIDDDGASFEIVMDTHSVELDMDIARQSTLEVGGEAWTEATWTGDGPKGHHREGTLSFVADGPAEGNMRLELGFDDPVAAEWVLTD
jgi:hypothetical protein